MMPPKQDKADSTRKCPITKNWWKPRRIRCPSKNI